MARHVRPHTLSFEVICSWLQTRAHKVAAFHPAAGARRRGAATIRSRAGALGAKMGRCGQLVIGPAGSGKSTYCELMRNHIETLNRRVHVVNLDPAAEHFRYPVAADIRDLISLEDVMTEMKLGPNGGLIYCMEYLIDNIDWLQARPPVTQPAHS